MLDYQSSTVYRTTTHKQECQIIEVTLYNHRYYLWYNALVSIFQYQIQFKCIYSSSVYTYAYMHVHTHVRSSFVFSCSWEGKSPELASLNRGEKFVSQIIENPHCTEINTRTVWFMWPSVYHSVCTISCVCLLSWATFVYLFESPFLSSHSHVVCLFKETTAHRPCPIVLPCTCS